MSPRFGLRLRRRPPVANRFKIGDMYVLVVSDGEAKFPGHMYFRGVTPEQVKPHERWFDHEGNVTFPFTCFVVNTGGRKVLIDTGLGPVKMFTFTGGALLDELKSAGVSPEEIDTVFITHLHVDHCGTAALPDGGALKPVFPNATYRWTTVEQRHWSTTPTESGSPDFDMAGMLEAIAPRWEAADDGAAIAPGMNVISCPGHTPGHAGVVLSSGNERAFVLGDAISCPVQLEETEWSGLGDIDPRLARESQEIVLREAEGDDSLLTAAHFPGLTFGRVLRGEGKRYWEPLK
jgi:glyoxylase-like metal-dependent hydrolase (beta-lactamase superfamily II)